MITKNLKAQGEAQKWVSQASREAHDLQVALQVLSRASIGSKDLEDLDARLDSIRRNLACARFSLEVNP